MGLLNPAAAPAPLTAPDFSSPTVEDVHGWIDVEVHPYGRYTVWTISRSSAWHPRGNLSHQLSVKGGLGNGQANQSTRT